MTKLGVFVGEDKWMFFSEIFEDLATRYETEVYKRRIYNIPILYGRLNRWEFHRGINKLLTNNDVCFFEWASELLMVASHFPKRCAMIARLHSFELYEWAPKINWDVVDRVILVSNAMQEMFNGLYPENAHKSVVIYNGRPLGEFTPPTQYEFNFNLGMLCRITPIKRVYETILMFYKLRKQGYDARLHIAGEISNENRYTVAVHRLVKKLNLEDNVVFYGHVADNSTWLRNIDIFISNSFWEGQSFSLMEAMASGCYCLSHRWDGAEEMLPEDQLYYTDDELIQKIMDFSENSEAGRQRLRSLMREIACDRFDINQTRARTRGVVQQLVSNVQ